MEIPIILIAVILLIPILILGIKELTNDDDPFMLFILKCSIVFAFIILIATLFLKEKPKAIDVYKGKTTLEITYKDRVPIDSTVVWKKINN